MFSVLPELTFAAVHIVKIPSPKKLSLDFQVLSPEHVETTIKELQAASKSDSLVELVLNQFPELSKRQVHSASIGQNSKVIINISEEGYIQEGDRMLGNRRRRGRSTAVKNLTSSPVATIGGHGYELSRKSDDVEAFIRVLSSGESAPVPQTPVARAIPPGAADLYTTPVKTPIPTSSSKLHDENTPVNSSVAASHARSPRPAIKDFRLLACGSCAQAKTLSEMFPGVSVRGFSGVASGNQRGISGHQVGFMKQGDQSIVVSSEFLHNDQVLMHFPYEGGVELRDAKQAKALSKSYRGIGIGAMDSDLSSSSTKVWRVFVDGAEEAYATFNDHKLQHVQFLDSSNRKRFKKRLIAGVDNIDLPYRISEGPEHIREVRHDGTSVVMLKDKNGLAGSRISVQRPMSKNPLLESFKTQSQPLNEEEVLKLSTVLRPEFEGRSKLKKAGVFYVHRANRREYTLHKSTTGNFSVDIKYCEACRGGFRDKKFELYGDDNLVREAKLLERATKSKVPVYVYDKTGKLRREYDRQQNKKHYVYLLDKESPQSLGDEPVVLRLLDTDVKDIQEFGSKEMLTEKLKEKLPHVTKIEYGKDSASPKKMKAMVAEAASNLDLL